MTRTLWLGFLVMVLVGCRLLTGSADFPPQSTIRLTAGQPRTLDPARTFGDAGGVIGHVFSGLVTFDQNLEIQPDLAAGWDVSDDGRTITFFLNPQARFHDGRAVTAQDVLFSWERALDPATGSETATTYLGDIAGADDILAGRSQSLSGVELLDEQTLRVTLTQPVPYFLAKLTYPATFIVDREQVADSDWEHAAIGTGPFRLREWLDDERIVLERNPDYHGPQGNVEHIVYEIGSGIPLALYENDRIDLVGVDDTLLSRVQDPNDPLSGEVQTSVSLCTTFVGFNNRIAPFDDARVRQAFNYALDKERLIEGLFQDNALPAGGILPPGLPGYSGHNLYPYDPQRARNLLEAAGYSEPLQLKFTTAGYSGAGGLPVAAIAMWQEALGADIDVELIEPYRYSDEIYAGNVGNMFSFGWCADYPDPQNFLDILFHSESRQNWGGYANPAIDQLLEQARIEQNTSDRLAAYQAIEGRLIEDAPYAFVAHSIEAVLVKPRIQNYRLLPIGIPQWHRVTIASN